MRRQRDITGKETSPWTLQASSCRGKD